MRSYKDFGQLLTTLVKDRFAVLRNAETAVDEAKKELNTARKTGDKAEKLSAELKLEEAKKALEAAENAVGNINNEIKAIRAELVDSVRAASVICTDDLDRETIALIDSGVCTASELATLFQKAENSTMRRYIGKFAEKSLATADSHSPDVAVLKSVVDNAKGYENPELHSAVQKFDYVSKVVSRCQQNPAMIGYFDTLTEQALSEM